MRAKAEFAKNTDKWNSCPEQSKNKKLHGRASWQFLYGCMKAELSPNFGDERDRAA